MRNSTPPSGRALCFSGQNTFWRCCTETNPAFIYYSPGICFGFDRACCKTSGIGSAWYSSMAECWAKMAYDNYGYTAMLFHVRERCCHEGGERGEGCFGGEFTIDKCCALPRQKTHQTWLDRGDPWSTVGTEIGVVCRGRSETGIECLPSSRPARSTKQRVAAELGLLLYCGPHLHRFAYDLLAMVASLNFRLRALSLSGRSIPGGRGSGERSGESRLLASCYEFFESQLGDLDASETPAVLMLSPLLEKFEIFSTGHAFYSLSEMMANDPHIGVVGMPTVFNSSWEWPLFCIRRAYWKLSFLHEPLGYSSWPSSKLGGEDAKHCFGADTTSGSRLYKSSVLLQLLRQGNDAPGLAAAGNRSAAALGSSWLPHLDLALKASGGPPALTCITGWNAVLHEASYLQHAELASSFLPLHDVEAARFHPQAAIQDICDGTVDVDQGMNQNMAGMVVSYCYRKALVAALASLRQAWEKEGTKDGEDARGSPMVVPLFGSAVSLFRLGATKELLPWEYDADFILFKPGVDVQRFKQRLFDTGFHLIQEGLAASPLHGPGEVHLQFEFQSRYGSPIIDIWLHEEFQNHNHNGATFSTSLSGFPVHFPLETLYWIRRRTAGTGLAPWLNCRNPGLPLVCKDVGHTACVPTIVEQGGFNRVLTVDGFIHLDVWD